MYTLVGQKCGTVLLDPRTTGVVNSEAVSRQSTITDNPVEGGGNIQDHVFCQPLTIQLQGTAINGADTTTTSAASLPPICLSLRPVRCWPMETPSGTADLCLAPSRMSVSRCLSSSLFALPATISTP